MNSSRIWAIGSATVMIVLLVAGWFLGVQPALEAAAAADIERTSVETQNAAKRAEIAQLTAENDDLAGVQKEYSALLESIPATSDSASFISGLDNLAASTGVQVTGITVGNSQAYTVPQSAAAAATPTDGTTPAPEATPVPVAETPVGVVAATSPLITGENFVGITVGVDLAGSYQSVLDFVKGLQSGTRLVLVTGFTSTANADSPDGSSVTAHIDGLIYVLKQN